ncbi:hypothetical protein EYF80_003992 [Liparis tanakae]|uniref:Uncharacterized protein n=1 Tax=Liparis tanakae TaxID=230148 RepID=A0A4Z2J5T3_9TELE|nr:hypothetical protein EYF80_003992 [Liparis tanakae]
MLESQPSTGPLISISVPRFLHVEGGLYPLVVGAVQLVELSEGQLLLVDGPVLGERHQEAGRHVKGHGLDLSLQGIPFLLHLIQLGELGAQHVHYLEFCLLGYLKFPRDTQRKVSKQNEKWSWCGEKGRAIKHTMSTGCFYVYVEHNIPSEEVTHKTNQNNTKFCIDGLQTNKHGDIGELTDLVALQGLGRVGGGDGSVELVLWFTQQGDHVTVGGVAVPHHLVRLHGLVQDVAEDLSVAGQKLGQVFDQLLNALQSSQLHDGSGLLGNGLWDRIS